MPRRLFRALALCLPLLLAGGCASSAPYWSPEDRRIAEANELRERALRLEAALAAAEERSATAEARAQALEREIAQLRSAASPPEALSPMADGGARATRSQEPVAAPKQRAEIEQSDLDEPEPTPDPLPGEPTLGAGAGPRELYEQSLQLLDQQRLLEAEEGFRRFLAENPGSDLADNAQFWLAESALRQTDVASALAGFRAVVENYPEANKVPDALLKVGYCLATLGEPDSAATVYRELLSRFPESTAAETARQRLGAP
ncbi:MAG: tol-pal system protein YbgF [Thermoanaerobaculia bacterium]